MGEARELEFVAPRLRTNVVSNDMKQSCAKLCIRAGPNALSNYEFGIGQAAWAFVLMDSLRTLADEAFVTYCDRYINSVWVFYTLKREKYYVVRRRV